MKRFSFTVNSDSGNSYRVTFSKEMELLNLLAIAQQANTDKSANIDFKF